MSRVIIVAVNRTGDYYLKRRVARFHRADLHRGCMGSEHSIIGNKKSILHVAGGMILGKIKCLEIMVIILNVRSTRDFEPHAPENIDDLVDHECQRMAASSRRPRSGERDIDALFGKTFGLSLLFDRLKSGIQ